MRAARRADGVGPAAILAVEGKWHVVGRYFPDERDATIARRIEAERRARVQDAAKCRRELRASRWELTEAGKAVLAQAKRNRELRSVIKDLIDERTCDIDAHGVCLTHDQPCTHVSGHFECPVARARNALDVSQRAIS